MPCISFIKMDSLKPKSSPKSPFFPPPLFLITKNYQNQEAETVVQSRGFLRFPSIFYGRIFPFSYCFFYTSFDFCRKILYDFFIPFRSMGRTYREPIAGKSLHLSEFYSIMTDRCHFILKSLFFYKR